MISKHRSILINGVLLMIAAFGHGMIAGWILRGFSRAPVAVASGIVISIVFVIWYARLYLTTDGTLGRAESGRKGSSTLNREE